MQKVLNWSPILWIGTPAALILAATLAARGGGVESGVNNVPGNSARMNPSCSRCHSGSFGNGPQVTLTVTKHALQPGESISMTTTATGGVSGTNGGFLTETATGTFTNGTGSRVNSNPASITHSNNNRRSWTYGYTAPNSPGLVEVYSVAMTSNGSGSSRDTYAFSGSDPNSAMGTPARLFVLPQGIVDTGPGCPDGFGNQSVLGANGVPTVGNSGFAFELHGVTPASLGFVLAGFNPPGFVSLPLGTLFGLTGCSGYVASPAATLTGLTGGGVPQRAEGSGTIALPIPAGPWQGTVLDVQGAYIDPTAVSALGRAFPVSFTNGLKVTLQ